MRIYFYPRSPCGERPDRRARRLVWLYFYPRSAPAAPRLFLTISIHALLAESDQCCGEAARAADYFYPRSPCGERRGTVRRRGSLFLISIHALLAESDLAGLAVHHSFSANFYPRSPCGERPAHWLCYKPLVPISIHALLAESDSLSGSLLHG